MLHVKTDEIYGKNDIVNANDYKTHVISIDSRFRANLAEPPSDFSYRLTHPMKNIIQVRPTSVEIPCAPYLFSKSKKNTMFRLDVTDYVGTQHFLTVVVPDGDYRSLDCLIEEIQRQLHHIRDVYGIFLRIAHDPLTRRVKIRLDGSGPPPSPPGPTNGPSKFGITWVMIGCEGRPFDFGLGGVLGFQQHFYVVDGPDFSLQSESPYQPPVPAYYLLAVDDFGAVQHRTSETELSVLGRVAWPLSPQDMRVEGGVTFPRPLDLARIRVRLLDPYGEPVDLVNANWSMTIEMVEVMNVELSDNYRNYLWSKEEPRVVRGGNGSAAVLAGRNFR
jgi:hypothetical protein